MQLFLTLLRSASDGESNWEAVCYMRQTAGSVMDDVLGPRSRTAAEMSLSSHPPTTVSTSVVVEWMSGSVIAVVVLGCLCLVLGIIYAYIYFTRINPHAGRSAAGMGRLTRKNQSQMCDDGSSLGVSTHVFLFKKS